MKIKSEICKLNILENEQYPSLKNRQFDKLLSNCSWPKNDLVIDFDSHPNKYLNWVPHWSTRCFQ